MSVLRITKCLHLFKHVLGDRCALVGIDNGLTEVARFDGLDHHIGLIGRVVSGAISSGMLSPIRNKVTGLPGASNSLEVPGIDLMVPA